MQDGMAYVMLGRPKRKEDLFITEDFDPAQIKCDLRYSLPESKRLDEVFDDAERIKREKRDATWKITYLNVRSMKSADGHRVDVALDNIIMNSDIFGLGETWLEKDSHVHFDGFNGYFSNFGNGKGVAGYTKVNLEFQPETVSSETYSAILFKTHEFHIIFLYLSHNFNTDDLFTLLDMWIEKDVPTSVIGDINQNMLNFKKGTFARRMKLRGFQQLLKEPTCDTGSLIDHIYINDAMKAQDVSTEINAAYYSDHDIISLNIPKKS